MEYFIGGTMIFGGNFAPRDWGFCQGATVSISENQALFAILGTTYGGDGRTTFGLPDFRSHVPAGIGRFPGLQELALGKPYGNQSNTLTVAQMPTHTPTAEFQPIYGPGGSSTPTATADLIASSAEGTSSTPIEGGYLAKANSPAQTGPDKDEFIYTNTLTNPTKLSSDSIDVKITGDSGGIVGGTVTIDSIGGGKPFSIMQPTVGANYIISLDGIFPTRN